MIETCAKPPTIEDAFSEESFATAYAWLIDRRKAYPPSSDVWSFRRRWNQEKASVRQQLAEGRYRFDVQDRVRRSDDDEMDLWSSRDALVVKCLALVLARYLPMSDRCFHIKGTDARRRGGKAALRQVWSQLPKNRFVLKTDVKSYYASIDHALLLGLLAKHVQDQPLLTLISRCLHRTVVDGGLFWEFGRGIPLRCPLSPVLGAFFLKTLDDALARTGLFYVRFMDDIIVLAPTRWKLRRAVKTLNQELRVLRLEKHPDKTFIGRIEHGFDFLGYRFTPHALTLARKTVENFAGRILRLYEQELRQPSRSPRLESYVRRWRRWTTAGLGGCSLSSRELSDAVQGAITEVAKVAREGYTGRRAKHWEPSNTTTPTMCGMARMAPCSSS